MTSNSNSNSIWVTNINSNSNEQNALVLDNQADNEILWGNNENQFIDTNFQIVEENLQKNLNDQLKQKFKRLEFIEIENLQVFLQN